MATHSSRYPLYETVDIKHVGRQLRREARNEGHERVYFPDNNGRLRLIGINDRQLNEHYVLSTQVMEQEFGIAYSDLNIVIEPTDIYVDDLEHRNERPTAFYSEDTPDRMTSQDASRQQQTSLPRIDELPLSSVADAWI